MRYCMNCGKQMGEERFCINCGADNSVSIKSDEKKKGRENKKKLSYKNVKNQSVQSSNYLNRGLIVFSIIGIFAIIWITGGFFKSDSAKFEGKWYPEDTSIAEGIGVSSDDYDLNCGFPRVMELFSDHTGTIDDYTIINWTAEKGRLKIDVKLFWSTDTWVYDYKFIGGNPKLTGLANLDKPATVKYIKEQKE